MELELKFALPLAQGEGLAQKLARVPLIGRRKPQRQTLHNTYYDTPLHALQDQRVALRVRQTGDAKQPRWVQTLKIGGTADSALSQRGEWEEALASEQLSSALLADTPWTELDPDGALYAALTPVFTTRFERLSWRLAIGEASVEVALDRGSVHMDGLCTPLCELEIELLSGAPEALFEAALQISEQLCLLPLHLSKAERAYRLAQGTLYAPLRAQPAALHPDMAFGVLAHSVLREAFLQFTANLCSLCSSDAPELLHQARVGWRRFKSALKLFKQHAPGPGDTQGQAALELPSLTPLKGLLRQMTALRDLDVASHEVLPTFAAAYQAGEATRLLQWQQLEAALQDDSARQRDALRHSLADPAVGRCLLQMTGWLELHAIAPPRPKRAGKKHRQQGQVGADWLRKRISKLADELESTRRQAGSDPTTQHRLRILSKRLRYGVESLRDLLPKKRAEHWLRLATETQTRIGLERDHQMAIAAAQRLRAAEGIVGFLRGAAFAAGQRNGPK